MAWITHTVRVEQLVQRRTGKLRVSLQAREKAESRMRESQEKMEHLSRLSVLGELSVNLAHELNQPLATIGTYVRSVLRRQAGDTLTPQAVSEACGEIANEAERAGDVVQRICHFSRKRSAVHDPVDVPTMVRVLKTRTSESRHRFVVKACSSYAEKIVNFSRRDFISDKSRMPW